MLEQIAMNDKALELKLQDIKDTLPLHGGDLHSSIQRYGIAFEHCIDLSTGINPNTYPIPIHAFKNLPYLQPDFIKACQQYYQQKHFLALAGSQAAIQVLPDIINEKNKFSVLVPEIGYQEHAKQWQRHGSAVTYYSSACSASMIATIEYNLSSKTPQHLIIIQPNNPTTVLLKTEKIIQWAGNLAPGAYLIVDEAFIDAEPEHSLLKLATLPKNVIVLRSFGKFFGLAGIRLGFIFADPSILMSLKNKLGVWQVNGPAQAIATKALGDSLWQNNARKILKLSREKTEILFAPLSQYFIEARPFTAPLFLSYSLRLEWALVLNDALAKAGILTRVIVLSEKNALLRIGLVDINDQASINHIKRVVNTLGNIGCMKSILKLQKDIFT